MSDYQTSSLPPEVPLPDWISSDLLQETKSVWQSEYGEDLTTADASDLLRSMGTLFEILYGERDEKKEESEQD